MSKESGVAKVAIFLTLISGASAFAQAGGGVKGGSFCELEVKAFGLGTLYPWLKTFGDKISPPVDADQFLQKLVPAAVRCIKNSPIAHISELNADLKRSAVNVAELDLAIFNEDEWDAHKNDPAARAGMFMHEFGPILKLPNDDRGYDTSAQITAIMRTDLTFSNPPAAIAQAPAYSDTYLLWCNSVRGELRRARDEARVADDTSEAQSAELITGLANAMKISAASALADQKENPPIAFWALTKGLEIVAVMREGLKGASEKDDMIFDFLQNYYGLLDTLFDSDFNVYGPDHMKVIEEFRFVFLQDMLGWLNRNYLVKTSDRNLLGELPVWNNFTLYYTLASSIAHLVDNSPLQNGHGCVMRDLIEVQTRVQTALGTPATSSAQATNRFVAIVSTLKRVQGEIGRPCDALPLADEKLSKPKL